jgi:ElaB/YqjD/DUF883 family membrane-anchored ribosome-binding protein
VPSFIKSENTVSAAGGHFDARQEQAMNSETGEFSESTTSSVDGPDGKPNMVHRVAQKAHQTVDKLEQSVSTGSEKVMSMQEEYGAYAREQVQARPLTMVASAFAIGLLLGRILR